jgi:hypothetical protein
LVKEGNFPKSGILRVCSGVQSEQVTRDNAGTFSKKRRNPQNQYFEIEAQKLIDQKAVAIAERDRIDAEQREVIARVEADKD